MYLTFWQLSSFDQDRVNGNEGGDEEVVLNGPFSVYRAKVKSHETTPDINKQTGFHLRQLGERLDGEFR